MLNKARKMLFGKKQEKPKDPLAEYVGDDEYYGMIETIIDCLYPLSYGITENEFLSITGLSRSTKLDDILGYAFREEASEKSPLKKEQVEGEWLYSYYGNNRERETAINKKEEPLRESIKTKIEEILKCNPQQGFSEEDLAAEPSIAIMLGIIRKRYEHAFKQALKELVQNESREFRIGQNGEYYFDDSYEKLNQLVVEVASFMKTGANVNKALTYTEIVYSPTRPDSILLQNALDNLVREHGQEGFIKTEDGKYIYSDLADRIYKKLECSPTRLFPEAQLEIMAQTQVEQKYFRTALDRLVKDIKIQVIQEGKKRKYRYLPPY